MSTAGYSNVGSKQTIMTVYLNIQLENATDATICDKCYFEVFFVGYCPHEHIKKSASSDIYVKSYATFTVFQKVKLAIMSPVVKFRVSLSKIYLCASVNIVTRL